MIGSVAGGDSDMLRLKPHADESARKMLEAGYAGEQPKCERGPDGLVAAQYAVEHTVSKALKALGVADGARPVVLHRREVV